MKSLRKNIFINKIIRSFIKKVGNYLPGWLRLGIIRRWRVSGIIDAILSEDIHIKYFSNCDDNIADALYYNPQEYDEISELQLFAALSKRGNVIFDVGANTGLYAITAARINPASAIFAFEPYPANAQRLLKNISINEVNNIELIQNAVGSSNSEVSFTVPEHDQICDVLSADRQFTERFYKKWITYKQITIDQISLDSFIVKKNIHQIDLMKIDVENYELEVLRGAKSTLQNYSPVILCEIFVDEERIRFCEEFLKPMGYSCYMILNNGLVKLEKLNRNPDCTNFLFSKKIINEPYLSFKEMERTVGLFMNQ